MKKNKKAFTLVELLVVIAILAILATVSILGYTSFTKKAKQSNCQSELSQTIEMLMANTLDGKEHTWSLQKKAAVAVKNPVFTLVAAKTEYSSTETYYVVDSSKESETKKVGALCDGTHFYKTQTPNEDEQASMPGDTYYTNTTVYVAPVNAYTLYLQIVYTTPSTYTVKGFVSNEDNPTITYSEKGSITLLPDTTSDENEASFNLAYREFLGDDLDALDGTFTATWTDAGALATITYTNKAGDAKATWTAATGAYTTGE